MLLNSVKRFFFRPVQKIPSHFVKDCFSNVMFYCCFKTWSNYLQYCPIHSNHLLNAQIALHCGVFLSSKNTVLK